MADLDIPPETTAEFLLRIGLYIGAVFQLTCILAILVLPDKLSDGSLCGRNMNVADHETWDSPAVPSRQLQHRLRKQDKKKRR